MQQQMFQINEKNIKEMADAIANEVANKIYHEFLFVKYLPEISAIEKGSIIPLKGREAKDYIKERIKSLGK